jgi:hypothetical protein
MDGTTDRAEIQFKASADGGYNWYDVSFTREEDALAWYDRKGATQSMEIDPDEIPESWEAFYNRAFPTCHHGLDGRSCMDPYGDGHFGTREQEMAQGW